VAILKCLQVEEPNNNISTLEKANIERDIDGFAKYLAYLLEAGLNRTPIATITK
jgi:hypothetical protein